MFWRSSDLAEQSWGKCRKERHIVPLDKGKLSLFINLHSQDEFSALVRKVHFFEPYIPERVLHFQVSFLISLVMRRQQKCHVTISDSEKSAWLSLKEHNLNIQGANCMEVSMKWVGTVQEFMCTAFIHVNGAFAREQLGWYCLCNMQKGWGRGVQILFLESTIFLKNSSASW